MNPEQFASAASLSKLSEIDKAVTLAFYFLKINAKSDFTVHEAAGWLNGLGYGNPNISRLRGYLHASDQVVKGVPPNTFKLHRRSIEKYEKDFPDLGNKYEVIHQGSIIPASVFTPSRGYVESLCKQINAAFENNVFDGCAVLMRRLMEILLIESFEHIKRGQDIRDANGNYFMLERILDQTKSADAPQLSRNSKEAAEVFRRLGNFSAHKIQYTCRRDDIKKVAFEYRALIEELLYKSGIRV